MKKLIIAFLFLFGVVVYAQDYTVVLMYHRVGDSRYPSTNISTEQFALEMNYLANEHYQVWPLAKVVQMLRAGKPLPDKVVSITFDDAYDSIFDHARPILNQHHFPYTIFVATNPIDHNYQEMMTWEQLRALHREGADIGNHSVHHPYLELLSHSQVQDEIAIAQQRILQELGVTPELFAYPYGEYNLAVRDTVAANGFSAAFTQSSGVMGSEGDFYLLPRFALNEHYANFDRFKLILTMKPLYINELQPSDTQVARDLNRISFKLSGLDTAGLHCYQASGALLPIIVNQSRAVLLLSEPLQPGRNKINCTLRDQAGHWHWGSLLFLVN